MKIRFLIRGSWGLACLLGLLVCSCATNRGDRGPVDLFDGASLQGWDFVLADPLVKLGQVWQVENGLLVCQGTPVGFLYRSPEVTNFRLVVEYRWAPGKEPGNSGIFSRLTPIGKPLPRGVEVQLKAGSAGDVLGLQGFKVASGQPRFFEIKGHQLAGDIAGVKGIKTAEAKPGEWNVVEIQAKGTRYRVWINGELVNDVTGVEAVPGPIGLQSEGGVVEFRRVQLERL